MPEIAPVITDLWYAITANAVVASLTVGAMSAIGTFLGVRWTTKTAIATNNKTVETAIATNNRTVETALATANLAAQYAYSNKIAEFRQNWINELRNDISQYCSSAERYVRLYKDTNESRGERLDFESPPPKEMLEHYLEARRLLSRIKLRINPDPSPHEKDFLKAIPGLIDAQGLRPDDSGKYLSIEKWSGKYDDVIEKSRLVLKDEWKATKTLLSPIIGPPTSPPAS